MTARRLLQLLAAILIVVGFLGFHHSFAAPATSGNTPAAAPSTTPGVTVSGRTATALPGYSFGTVTGTTANVLGSGNSALGAVECSCDKGGSCTLGSRGQTVTCGGDACCELSYVSAPKSTSNPR